jgi:hypothetical protein
MTSMSKSLHNYKTLNITCKLYQASHIYAQKLQEHSHTIYEEESIKEENSRHD